MSSPFRTIKIFGFALACAVAAWLSFIDPIWQAYLEFAEKEFLAVAGIGVSVCASLIGAACAVYQAFADRAAAANRPLDDAENSG